MNSQNMQFELSAVSKARASGLMTVEQAEKQCQEIRAKYTGSPGGSSVHNQTHLKLAAVDKAVAAGLLSHENAEDQKREIQRQAAEAAGVRVDPPSGPAYIEPSPVDVGGWQGASEQRARIAQLPLSTPEYRPRGGSPNAAPVAPRKAPIGSLPAQQVNAKLGSILPTLISALGPVLEDQIYAAVHEALADVIPELVNGIVNSAAQAVLTRVMSKIDALAQATAPDADPTATEPPAA